MKIRATVDASRSGFTTLNWFWVSFEMRVCGNGTELADRSGRASPAMVERLNVGFMSFVWVHANTMRSAGG